MKNWTSTPLSRQTSIRKVKIPTMLISSFSLSSSRFLYALLYNLCNFWSSNSVNFDTNIHRWLQKIKCFIRYPGFLQNIYILKRFIFYDPNTTQKLACNFQHFFSLLNSELIYTEKFSIFFQSFYSSMWRVNSRQLPVPL